MKIELAHDSFTQLGGAERVMDALHELFPEAQVYTTVLAPKLRERYKGWDIHTSLLQGIYKVYPNFQHLLPLIPAAIDALKIGDCDVLLSSSSSFIKAVRKPKGSIHINYCHTPTRFVWSEPGYVKHEVPMVLLPFARFFLKFFKRWDYAAAQRLDYIIANSKEVQGRIKKYYNRESEIIYPFVDTSFWKPTKPKQNYFLLAGRLHEHKNSELIINIFNELGLPLHVVGTGRQEKYLKSIAKSNIVFLGRVSDEALRDEYSGALGYLYPQFEDFGINPLEAASCGTASIGWAIGGSLETILSGSTGELFLNQDKEEITKIIQNWDAKKYNPGKLREHAARFSKEIFQLKISDFVNKTYHEHRS